jgi:chromosomal replication initiator protein
MQALLSGRLGLGVILQDDSKPFIISDGASDIVRSTDAQEVHVLLNQSQDFVEYEGKDTDEVRTRLRELSQTEESLNLLLVSLDPEHSDQLRYEALLALNDNLKEKPVAQSLQYLFYARPLSKSSDIEKAIEYAAMTKASGVGAFLKELRSNQPAIEKTWMSWDYIPLEVFESKDARLTLQSAMIRDGHFYRVSSALQKNVSVLTIDSAVRNEQFVGKYKGYDSVLNCWTKNLATIISIAAHSWNDEIKDDFRSEIGNELYRINAKGTWPAVPEQLGALWDVIRWDLRKVVPEEVVSLWLDTLRLNEYKNHTLYLEADKFYQTWIGLNCLDLLRTSASRVLNEPVSIQFKTSPVALPTSKRLAYLDYSSKKYDWSELFYRHQPWTRMLNPSLTFDNFVVGGNYTAAAALARDLALMSSHSHNLLFIHGGWGLGKTHLMQAIGNQFKNDNNRMVVFYVTSDEFTKDYYSAVQNNSLSEFRKEYCRADVLLIDDIHALKSDDGLHDEFLFLYDSLRQAGRKMVLSSNSAPEEIDHFDKGLLSHFLTWQIAELPLPDEAARLAILRHKAAILPKVLDEPVLTFMAANVKTNVRLLESALHRVAAMHMLGGSNVTVPQAEVVLRDILEPDEGQIRYVEVIKRRVGEIYGMDLAGMITGRELPEVAMPRMVAIYLARQLTAASTIEIGNAFGSRDAGEVMRVSQAVKAESKRDEDLRRLLATLTEQLKTILRQT